MIYVTADHGGWDRKRKLVAWLHASGFQVVDLLPRRPGKDDDYPLRAAELAGHVTRSSEHRGIAVCRSGVGMAIAANKIGGIRAAQAFNPSMAAKSRTDENANVLSLDAEYTTESAMKRIVDRWLGTRYVPSVRYERRLRQLKRLDRGR